MTFTLIFCYILVGAIFISNGEVGLGLTIIVMMTITGFVCLLIQAGAFDRKPARKTSLVKK